MKGLIADAMHYIRRGDGLEELYLLDSDAEELSNLAAFPFCRGDTPAISNHAIGDARKELKQGFVRSRGSVARLRLHNHGELSESPRFASPSRHAGCGCSGRSGLGAMSPSARRACGI